MDRVHTVFFNLFILLKILSFLPPSSRLIFSHAIPFMFRITPYSVVLQNNSVSLSQRKIASLIKKHGAKTSAEITDVIQAFMKVAEIYSSENNNCFNSINASDHQYSEDTFIKSAQPFSWVPILYMKYCCSLVNVDSLRNCTKVDLTHCSSLVDIQGLENVSTVILDKCYRVLDVTPLAKAKYVSLRHC